MESSPTQAVRLMQEAGGNLAEAARRGGLPRETLKSRWGRAVREGLATEEDRKRWGLPAPIPDETILLRNRLRGVEKEVRELRSGEDLRRAVLGAISAIGTGLPLLPATTLPPTPAASGALASPVLLLSDWHYGEVVRASEVRGVNAYDTEIADARIIRTLGTVRELLTVYEKGPWDGGVLILAGDLINGIIHEELRDSAQTSVTRDVLSVLPHLRAAVEMMADVCGRVRVFCVVGNHGRLTQNKRFKGRQEQNFEWIAYQFLRLLLSADKRVSIKVSDSEDIQIEVQGTRLLITHGDRFSGGGGIGGIFSPIMRGVAKTAVQSAIWGDRFDHVVMGHWHQLIFGDQFIINGSLKGACQFSLGMGFPPQTPQQALWIIHRGKGIISERRILADGTDKMRSGLGRKDYLRGF